MSVINIMVRRKTAANPVARIVCGNSDYKIAFNFDEEWAAHDTKTARFIWNGQYADVVFTGNVCDVPVITNTTMVAVGVYAGDLCTTTPALIRCDKSILCGEGLPVEPPPNVYAQIIELLNNSADDYNKLGNKPTINGNVLEGDMTNKSLGLASPTPEEIGGAVSDWLDKHPEATTTVSDGAITTEKIADKAVTLDKLATSVQEALTSRSEDSVFSLDWEPGRINYTNGNKQSGTTYIRTASTFRVKAGDKLAKLSQAYNVQAIRYTADAISSTNYSGYVSAPNDMSAYTFTAEDENCYFALNVQANTFVSLEDSVSVVDIYRPPRHKPIKQEQIPKKFFTPEYICGLEVGRNKFPNFDVIYDKYIENNGALFDGSYSNAAGTMCFNATTRFFAVKPGTVYTNSTANTANASIRIAFYDENLEYITGSFKNLGNSASTRSATSPDNAAWARVSFYADNLNIMQLVEGSDVYLDYQPWEVRVPENVNWDDPAPNADFSAESDSTIETVLETADNGNIRYLHLTDLHAGNGGLTTSEIMGFKSMRHVAEQIAADFILLTGDIIAGGTGTTADGWKKTLLQISDIFRDCHIPVITSQGNHDDNSIAGLAEENIIFSTWWLNRMQKCFARENRGFVAPTGSTGYGYIDFPDKKLRLVNISSSDLSDADRLAKGGQNNLPVSQAQIDWLNTDGFVVPDGWKIICCCHMSPVSGMAVNAGITGADALYSCLTAHADKIIAFNFGHVHMSCNYLDPTTGIYFIGQTNAGGTIMDASKNGNAKFGYSSASSAAKTNAATGAFNFGVCMVKPDGTVEKIRWGVEDDLSS